MNSPRKHTSRIREQIKSEGDYVRRARLPKRMKIAMIISDALENRNWNDKELANKLDKYSSQVSKWLKGDHNFTIDTLSDIEEILGINLLNFDKYLTYENATVPELNATRQYPTADAPLGNSYRKYNSTLIALKSSQPVKSVSITAEEFSNSNLKHG